MNSGHVSGSPFSVIIQNVVALKFQQAFDENGVLYYIATAGGTHAYSNPHTSGRVVVSVSSICNGSAERFVQGASHNDQYNFTDEVPDSWMAVDLNRQLAPNYYCLRSGKQPASYKVRNWRLEGSKDGSSWTCLREHVNDSSLAATAFSVAAWPIENASAAVFRHFRVFQTAKNSSGTDMLACAGMELYGTLLPEEHA